MNDSKTTTSSTLGKILSEVEQDQASSEELERQMAELQQKSFGVSKTYQAFRHELEGLVLPLEVLLPNVAEYEEYAAPHDGLAAGANWDGTAWMTPARKRVHLTNPGSLVLTQCNRCDESSIPFSHLSDDEYLAYLDSVELMADWWEKRHSTDALQLAKSIIVHTVLNDPELRDLVLQKAHENVGCLTVLNADLRSWRKSQ